METIPAESLKDWLWQMVSIIVWGVFPNGFVHT